MTWSVWIPKRHGRKGAQEEAQGRANASGLPMGVWRDTEYFYREGEHRDGYRVRIASGLPCMYDPKGTVLEVVRPEPDLKSIGTRVGERSMEADCGII